MLKIKASIPDCSLSATGEWPDLKMERKEWASSDEIVVSIEDKKVKVKARDLLEVVKKLQ